MKPDHMGFWHEDGCDVDHGTLGSVCNQKAEVARLRRIEEAARNLVRQKGRYNTEQAYNRLTEVLNEGLD